MPMGTPIMPPWANDHDIAQLQAKTAPCYMHTHASACPYENHTRKYKKKTNNKTQKYDSLIKSRIVHSCIISSRH